MGGGHVVERRRRAGVCRQRGERPREPQLEAREEDSARSRDERDEEVVDLFAAAEPESAVGVVERVGIRGVTRSSRG